MFSRDLKHLDLERWTISIEDVYLGMMWIRVCNIGQAIDVGMVPVEVIVGCVWIERRTGKAQS